MGRSQESEAIGDHDERRAHIRGEGHPQGRRATGPLFVLIALCGLLALAPRLVAQARADRVSFRALDGALLAGSFYETSSRPSPAVVLVHMYTRNRRDWDLVATRLASSGVAALTFDLRGHGESSPAPTEEGAAPAAMARDVAAAIRFLHGRGDVLPGRTGLAGASLGANLVVVYASTDASVRALVLLSPTLDYRGVRIEAAARKFAGPMLLVASREDAFALRTVRGLTAPRENQTGARQALVLEHAGHGTTMFARDGSLVQSIVDFFHRTL